MQTPDVINITVRSSDWAVMYNVPKMLKSIFGLAYLFWLIIAIGFQVAAKAI